MSLRFFAAPLIPLILAAGALCAPANAALVRPSSVVVGSTQAKITTRATAQTVNAAGLVSSLRVFNYYPSTHGWSSMWTNWQPAQMNTDFGRIAGLGANTVRLMVFPSVFGYGAPSVPAAMASEFAQAITMASNNGLKVQLTLFDWFGNWDQTAKSITWVDSLLAPYTADARISVAELANEVDPTNAQFISWSRALLPELHRILPLAATTMSVTGDLTSAPARLSQLVTALRGYGLDIADIHFYGAVGDAYQFLLNAKAAAAGLPLFIGETGMSLQSVPGQTYDAAEAAQAAYFDAVFRAAQTLGVSRPGTWNVYDFTSTAMPPDHTLSTAAHFYGVLDTNGALRPAATVIKNWFLYNQPADLIHGGFDQVGTDGAPNGWSEYYQTYGTLAYSTSVGHTAAGSMSFTNTGTPAGGVPSIRTRPTSPVIAGQTWTLKSWAMGTNTSGFNRIALSWFDKTGTWIRSSESTGLPKGTTSWTQLSVSATVPAKATSVMINLLSAGNKGTVRFDDVTVAFA